jgi:hypothetical protein
MSLPPFEQERFPWNSSNHHCPSGEYTGAWITDRYYRGGVLGLTVNITTIRFVADIGFESTDGLLGTPVPIRSTE